MSPFSPVSRCVSCPFCALCSISPVSPVPSASPCVPCIYCVPCVSLCPLVSLVSSCVPCVACVPLCPLSRPVSLVSLVFLVSPEIYGGVAVVSLIAWKLWWVSFLSYYMLRFFFTRPGGQRMWFFMKKFCLTCLENNLCLLALLWFIPLENLWLNPGVISRAMFARALKELRNNNVSLGKIFAS